MTAARAATATKKAGGFTLLEMMIALAILAISLTWLIEATTRAVEAENHSKLVTTATFLARQQMVELEFELQEKGMQDDAFASEKCGDFEESGFKRFGWCRISEKITLPGTDTLQTAIGNAATGGGLPGGAAGGVPPGGMGGVPGMASGTNNMMTGQFGLIKEVLEQGIRKATVTIAWTEHGLKKTIEVSEYITDPRRVDQAIQLPNMAGMPGAAGGTGPPTTGVGGGNGKAPGN